MSEERYEIIKLLGKGRTGGVYEAEDTRLGRKVAMRRFVSQNELTDVSEYEENFVNIAQSLSALQHPNLLRVFDAGTDEDGAFIISQLLEGDNVHDRLKEGPLSNWDTWDIGHQMLDAMSTAHAAGFVHGAITPGSIMMTPRARGGYLYVILDMGLSRLAPLIQGKDSVLSMMADPAILAPELFDGTEATPKSDLYMLGNILYMCLAGGHPFAGKSLEECSELHQQGLPNIKEFAPDAPDDLVYWIQELCEVNPVNRPESVVVALRTMPKVEKPARAAMSPINTTNPLAPATGVGTAIHSTPQQGMLATGPLTAGPSSYGAATQPGSNAGVQQAPGSLTGPYVAPKKSYKGLIITVVVLAVLGVALAFIMGGGDKRTGEQIAADKAKKQQKSKNVSPKLKTSPKRNKAPKNNPSATSSAPEFEPEEVLAFRVGNNQSQVQGWKLVFRNQHRNTVNGWSIVGKKGTNPGLAKRITGTDIEDMYKKGWSIKYEDFTRLGDHTFGFYLSAEENEYWMKKNLPVSLLLQLSNQGDKLVISDKASGASHTLEGLEKSFVTYELRGKPRDTTGSYQLYINGDLIEDFKGKLGQKGKIRGDYVDHLYSAAGHVTVENSNWVIKSLTLTVGTPKSE